MIKVVGQKYVMLYLEGRGNGTNKMNKNVNLKLFFDNVKFGNSQLEFLDLNNGFRDGFIDMP